MTDAFLSCRGVEKRFGTTAAVAGVDLDVTNGHLLSLVGPSGCGKTTLLRLIAGFEAPDKGTIELDGVTLNGAATHVPPEKRRVSLVFQDFALFPHMNVASNIAFGLPKGALDDTAVEALSNLPYDIPNLLVDCVHPDWAVPVGLGCSPERGLRAMMGVMPACARYA